MCHGLPVEVKRQLVGLSSLLPPSTRDQTQRLRLGSRALYQRSRLMKSGESLLVCSFR